MPYSDEQKQYFIKRPANVLYYEAVQFYHPDFGYIRLVGNQYKDKAFTIDSSSESFQAVSMEVPTVTNQSTDNTQAGTIIFGRIGVDVRNKLKMITPSGSVNYPIEARLLQFRSDDLTGPVYDRTVYVDNDGIVINQDTVNIKLAVKNPAKATRKDLFYDPAIFVGLQTI